MKTLKIVGVSPLSDAYPNIKYKIKLIDEIKELNVEKHIYDLNSVISNEANKKGILRKIKIILKFIYLNLKLSIQCIPRKETNYYITYPGILMSPFLALIKRKQCKIYLDAFISIYDTAVNDRKIVKRDALLAKLLFFIEKISFTSANMILVDTPENADFLSKLFKIEKKKFVAIPLCIPPLSPIAKSDKQKKSNCLFIGTFVPLQGVKVIAESARILSTTSSISITVVGDGQDAESFNEILNSFEHKNVTWHRVFLETDELEELLNKTNICLGIFGNTDKAMRVIPYKLYYYLSKGKTVITQETPAIATLQKELGTSLHNLITCKNNAIDLSATIAKTCIQEQFDVKKCAEIFLNKYGNTRIKNTLKAILVDNDISYD